MRKKKYSISLRGISLALAISFLLSDISWAAPGVSLGAFSLASNPAFLHLSADTARITETYKGTQPKLIIQVQDAHTNLSAQRNIAKILDELVRRYGVKSVFVEGGTRDDSLTFLRPLADKKTRDEVAVKYLMRAQLNGAEYLSLSSDDDVRFLGVEDAALYRESVQDYAAVANHRGSVIAYIKEVEQRVDGLKRRLYPSEILAWDDFLGKFSAHEKSYTEYFDFLSSLAERFHVSTLGSPNFLSLESLKKTEQNIDFDRASEEQANLIARLHPTASDDLAPPKEMKEAARLRSRDAQKISYYGRLFAAAGKENIPVSEYPHLAAYVDYLHSAVDLDLDALMQETGRIEEAVFRAGLENESAFYLYEISAYLKNLEDLFSLQISRERFDEYVARKSDFRFQTVVLLSFLNKKLCDLGRYSEVVRFLPLIDDNLKEVEAFYAETEKRDEIFVRKTLQNMQGEKLSVAVLLTGGYHTPNLKELLKKEGVSYAVVSPVIAEETNMKRYEEILFGQLTGAKASSGSGTRAGHLQQGWVMEGTNPQLVSVGTIRSEFTGQVPAETQLVDGARLAMKLPKFNEPIPVSMTAVGIGRDAEGKLRSGPLREVVETRQIPAPSSEALREFDVDLVVAAVGVNRSNAADLQGRSERPVLDSLEKDPRDFHVPGHETVALVRKVGTGVTDLKVGDVVVVRGFAEAEGKKPVRIIGRAGTGNGLQSQYYRTDRTFLHKIPEESLDKFTVQEAAVWVNRPTTSYRAAELADLSDKDTVLVHLGGTGHLFARYAKDIFKVKRVVGVGSNDETGQALIQQGLIDAFVNRTRYSDPRSFEQAVRNANDGELVTKVFNHAGADTIERDLAALKPGGILVPIGNTAGPKAAFHGRAEILSLEEQMERLHIQGTDRVVLALNTQEKTQQALKILREKGVPSFQIALSQPWAPLGRDDAAASVVILEDASRLNDFLDREHGAAQFARIALVGDTSNIEFKIKWFLVFYLQRTLQFADGTQIRGSTEGTRQTVDTVLSHFLNGHINIPASDIGSAPLEKAGELYQKVWDNTLGKPFGVLLVGAERGDMTLAELRREFLSSGARLAATPFQTLIDDYFFGSEEVSRTSQKTLLESRLSLTKEVRVAVDDAANEIVKAHPELLSKLLNMNAGEQKWQFARFKIHDDLSMELGFDPESLVGTMSGQTHKGGSIRIYEPKNRAEYMRRHGLTNEREYEDHLFEKVVRIARRLVKEGHVSKKKRFDPLYLPALAEKFKDRQLLQPYLSIEELAQTALLGEPALDRWHRIETGYLTGALIRLARVLLSPYLKKYMGKEAAAPMIQAKELSKAVFGEGDHPRIWLKLENRSPIGSYKLWGAIAKVLFVANGLLGSDLSKIAERTRYSSLARLEENMGFERLSPEVLKHLTFVTASAGNHAQGVATAANEVGAQNLIFVPESIPKVKEGQILSKKGVLRKVQGTFDDAYREALYYEAAEEGAIMVSPSEPPVIAGHGAAIGLSLLSQSYEHGFRPDAVFAPVGTGGLISGIALALQEEQQMLHLGDLPPNSVPQSAYDKDIQVIGVEVEGSSAMKTSLAARSFITLDSVQTIADGKKVRHPGIIPYLFLQFGQIVDEIMVSKEVSIQRAIKLLFTQENVRAEGAGALALTPLIEHPDLYRDMSDIVVIVTGENIDETLFSDITSGARFASSTDRYNASASALIEKFKALYPRKNIMDWLEVYEMKYLRSSAAMTASPGTFDTELFARASSPQESHVLVDDKDLEKIRAVKKAFLEMGEKWSSDKSEELNVIMLAKAILIAESGIVERETDDKGRFDYKGTRYPAGALYGGRTLAIRPSGKTSGFRVYSDKVLIAQKKPKGEFTLLEVTRHTDDKGRFSFKGEDYSLGADLADSQLTLRPYARRDWSTGFKVYYKGRLVGRYLGGARLAEEKQKEPELLADDASYPNGPSAVAYGQVDRSRWFQDNKQYTFGGALVTALVQGLGPGAVVLDVSTGTGGASLTLAQMLKASGNSISRLITTDVDFPLAREFTHYAQKLLRAELGTAFWEISSYILPFNKTVAGGTYTSVSEIPEIRGRVDMAMMLNAIHLVRPNQRASTFLGIYDSLKPGAFFIVGSAGLHSDKRPENVVIMDTFFDKVDKKAIEIISADGKYASIRAEVSRLHDDEGMKKKRAGFLMQPKVEEVVQALKEVGFAIPEENVGFHETVLTRDDFRQFILGVPAYEEMAFPEFQLLDAQTKNEILGRAYNELFDEAPNGEYRIWWTTIFAQKPKAVEAGARLADDAETIRARKLFEDDPDVFFTEPLSDLKLILAPLKAKLMPGLRSVEREKIFAEAWNLIRERYKDLSYVDKIAVGRELSRPKASDIVKSSLFSAFHEFKDTEDPLHEMIWTKSSASFKAVQNDGFRRYVPTLEELQLAVSQWGFTLEEAAEYVTALYDGNFEDESVFTGIGTFVDPDDPKDKRPVVVVGLQKGKNFQEMMARNQGMTKPWGYWQAVRAYRLAEKLRLPIVTFVDSPGADNSLVSEIHNQSGAVSYAIQVQQELTVPAIHFITGEAGSAGSMTATQAGPTYMWSNAQRYVAVLEGSYSIIDGDKIVARIAKSRNVDLEKTPEAFETLKKEFLGVLAESCHSDAERSLKDGINSGVIAEPLGGAHRFPEPAYRQMGHLIADFLRSQDNKTVNDILEERYRLFRSDGEKTIRATPLRRTRSLSDAAEFASLLAEAKKAVPGFTTLESHEEAVKVVRAFKSLYPDADEKWLAKVIVHGKGHFAPQPIGIQNRIEQLVDRDAAGAPMILEELNADISDEDGLIDFYGPLAKAYPDIFRVDDMEEKLKKAQIATGSLSGVFTGYAKIGGKETLLIVKDPRWVNASDTSAVTGEKITLALENVLERNRHSVSSIPVIFVDTASGARQQDGQRAMDPLNKILSGLMRAKASGSKIIEMIAYYTYGGDSASFATYQDADVILLEAGSSKGFTGKKVVKQTEEGRRKRHARSPLLDFPKVYQSDKFLLARGHVDGIVTLDEEKAVILALLDDGTHVADSKFRWRVGDIRNRRAQRVAEVRRRERKGFSTLPEIAVGHRLLQLPLIRKIQSSNWRGEPVDGSPIIKTGSAVYRSVPGHLAGDDPVMQQPFISQATAFLKKLKEGQDKLDASGARLAAKKADEKNPVREAIDRYTRNIAERVLKSFQDTNAFTQKPPPVTLSSVVSEDRIELRTQEMGRKILDMRRDEKGANYWKDEIVQFSLRLPFGLGSLVRLSIAHYQWVQWSFAAATIGTVIAGYSFWALIPAVFAASYFLGIPWIGRRFVVSGDEKKMNEALQELTRQGIEYTLDRVAEAAKTEKEAIENTAAIVGMFNGHPGRNISIKLTALTSNLNGSTKEAVKERLRAIFRAAVGNKGFICIDVEQYKYRDLSFEIYKEVIAEQEFAKESQRLGIVIQAYLVDSEKITQDLIQLAGQRYRQGLGPLSFRLVKGAYWDAEVREAKAKGETIPVWYDEDPEISKQLTDAAYERITDLLMPHYKEIKLAFATHNVRSMAHVIAVREALGIDRAAFDFEMLYGMGDTYKRALVALGYHIRAYVPEGSIGQGLKYLVRRLIENTSQQGILANSLRVKTEKDIRALLASPHAKDNEKYVQNMASKMAEFPLYLLWPGENGLELKKADDYLKESQLVMAAKTLKASERPAYFFAFVDGASKPKPEDQAHVAHGFLASVTLKLYLENDQSYTLIETIANDPMLLDPFHAMVLKRDETPSLYLNVEKRGWGTFLKELRTRKAINQEILKYNYLPETGRTAAFPKITAVWVPDSKEFKVSPVVTTPTIFDVETQMHPTNILAGLLSYPIPDALRDSLTKLANQIAQDYPEDGDAGEAKREKYRQAIKEAFKPYKKKWELHWSVSLVGVHVKPTLSTQRAEIGSEYTGDLLSLLGPAPEGARLSHSSMLVNSLRSPWVSFDEAAKKKVKGQDDIEIRSSLDDSWTLHFVPHQGHEGIYSIGWNRGKNELLVRWSNEQGRERDASFYPDGNPLLSIIDEDNQTTLLFDEETLRSIEEVSPFALFGKGEDLSIILTSHRSIVENFKGARLADRPVLIEQFQHEATEKFRLRNDLFKPGFSLRFSIMMLHIELSKLLRAEAGAVGKENLIKETLASLERVSRSAEENEENLDQDKLQKLIEKLYGLFQEGRNSIGAASQATSSILLPPFTDVPTKRVKLVRPDGSQAGARLSAEEPFDDSLFPLFYRLHRTFDEWLHSKPYVAGLHTPEGSTVFFHNKEELLSYVAEDMARQQFDEGQRQRVAFTAVVAPIEQEFARFQDIRWEWVGVESLDQASMTRNNSLFLTALLKMLVSNAAFWAKQKGSPTIKVEFKADKGTIVVSVSQSGLGSRDILDWVSPPAPQSKQASRVFGQTIIDYIKEIRGDIKVSESGESLTAELPILAAQGARLAANIESEMGSLTRSFLKPEEQSILQQVEAYVQQIVTPEIISKMETGNKIEDIIDFLRLLNKPIDGKNGPSIVGAAYPKEFGGSGLGAVAESAITTALSEYGSQSIALIHDVRTTLTAYLLFISANEAQKEKYLRPLLTGEKFGAFGLTEPQSGSDAQNMRTVAQRRGDKWFLNGSKTFITDGTIADFVIVFAKIRGENDDRAPEKIKEIGAFIVPIDKVHAIADHISTMGVEHGSGTAFISLQDAEVPDEDMLSFNGETTKSFAIAMKTLEAGRISISSIALGAMKVALHEVVKKSEQKPGSVSREDILDIASEIYATTTLLLHAARKREAGQDFNTDAAMVKLLATETALQITTRAMEIIGPDSLRVGHPLERDWRDGKLNTIGEGTTQIMRIVITAMLKKAYTQAHAVEKGQTVLFEQAIRDFLETGAVHDAVREPISELFENYQTANGQIKSNIEERIVDLAAHGFELKLLEEHARHAGIDLASSLFEHKRTLVEVLAEHYVAATKRELTEPVSEHPAERPDDIETMIRRSVEGITQEIYEHDAKEGTGAALRDHSRELIQKMGALGYLGTEEYRNFILQTVSETDLSLAAVLLAQEEGIGVINRYAPEKKILLDQLNSGKQTIATALDDQAGDRTVFEKTKSGQYNISGGKALVVNGAASDMFLVFASDKDNGETKAFLVKRSQTGIKISPIDTLGLKGSSIADVTFENAEAVILKGFDKEIRQYLQEIRTGAVRAMSLGASRTLIDKGTHYAKYERFAFGSAIYEKPPVKRLLGEAEAIRSKMEHDAEPTKRLREVAESVVQVYGGNGLDETSGVFRFRRDAQTLRILVELAIPTGVRLAIERGESALKQNGARLADDSGTVLKIGESHEIKLQWNETFLHFFQQLFSLSKSSEAEDLFSWAIGLRDKEETEAMYGFGNLLSAIQGTQFKLKIVPEMPELFRVSRSERWIMISGRFMEIQDAETRRAIFKIGLGQALRKETMDLHEMDVLDLRHEDEDAVHRVQKDNLALIIQAAESFSVLDQESLKKLKAEEEEERLRPWIEEVHRVIQSIVNGLGQNPRSVRELRDLVRQRLATKMEDSRYREGVESELAKLDITAHHPKFYSLVKVRSDEEDRYRVAESFLAEGRDSVHQKFGADIFKTLNGNAAILDLGFGGETRELLVLAQRFPNVGKIIGIDIDASAVDDAIQKLKEGEGLAPFTVSKKDRDRIEIKRANAEDLTKEFQNETFDLIFASQSLDVTAFEDALEKDVTHHGIASWIGMGGVESEPANLIVSHMIEESYRVLKPGGYLISGSNSFGSSDPTLSYYSKFGFEIVSNEGVVTTVKKPISALSHTGARLAIPDSELVSHLYEKAASVLGVDKTALTPGPEIYGAMLMVQGSLTKIMNLKKLPEDEQRKVRDLIWNFQTQYDRSDLDTAKIDSLIDEIKTLLDKIPSVAGARLVTERGESALKPDGARLTENVKQLGQQLATHMQAEETATKYPVLFSPEQATFAPGFQIFLYGLQATPQGVALTVTQYALNSSVLAAPILNETLTRERMDQVRTEAATKALFEASLSDSVVRVKPDAFSVHDFMNTLVSAKNAIADILFWQSGAGGNVWNSLFRAFREQAEGSSTSQATVLTIPANKIFKGDLAQTPDLDETLRMLKAIAEKTKHPVEIYLTARDEASAQSAEAKLAVMRTSFKSDFVKVSVLRVTAGEKLAQAVINEAGKQNLKGIGQIVIGTSLSEDPTALGYEEARQSAALPENLKSNIFVYGIQDPDGNSNFISAAGVVLTAMKTAFPNFLIPAQFGAYLERQNTAFGYIYVVKPIQFTAELRAFFAAQRAVQTAA